MGPYSCRGSAANELRHAAIEEKRNAPAPMAWVSGSMLQSSGFRGCKSSEI